MRRRILAAAGGLSLLACMPLAAPPPTPSPTADVPQLTEKQIAGLVADRCRSLACSSYVMSQAQATYLGANKWEVSIPYRGRQAEPPIVWDIANGVITPRNMTTRAIEVDSR